MPSEITKENIKEDILSVFDELYGLEKLTPQKLFILDRIYDEPDLEKLYTEVTEEEKEANILLHGFDRENPGVLNRANLSDVLTVLRSRKEENNS